MDLNSINCFITIAREKSITKASHLLHITQPALTSKLKQMENEIGAKLFKRSRQGVELTKEGGYFLIKALRMTREFAGVNQENNILPYDLSTSLTNEKFKIGITRPLAPLLLSSLLSHCDPSITYDITVEFNEMIIDLVLFNELHMGIIRANSYLDDLVYLPLYKDELVMAGPKNEFTTGNPFNTGSFLSEPFFLYDSSIPFRSNIIEILLDRFGRLPEKVQEVNDTFALISMISCGLGYAILPLSFIPNTSIDQMNCYSIERNIRSLNDNLPFTVTRLGDQAALGHIHIIYSKSRENDDILDAFRRRFALADL
ncbi:LysR family transcriptional regulator [Bacillus dakarensis]|uniref:LysR family transcriptional regulator n=1 Tax=Robertmurraya dakarensis TaxID=1926278 RepID=UPI0009818431|nr:LysR family transcriptional regulator [Bacillus dakarensis]